MSDHYHRRLDSQYDVYTRRSEGVLIETPQISVETPKGREGPSWRFDWGAFAFFVVFAAVASACTYLVCTRCCYGTYPQALELKWPVTIETGPANRVLVPLYPITEGESECSAETEE